MSDRGSNLSRWIKEWPFFAAVALLLILGTLWSRPRPSIPADEVREIVRERLAEALRLEWIDLTVFGTRERTDGSQIASVRLQGELLDLRFEGSGGDWSWQGVVRAEGIESSVEDYVRRLRDGNERGRNRHHPAGPNRASRGQGADRFLPADSATGRGRIPADQSGAGGTERLQARGRRFRSRLSALPFAD